MALQEKEEVKDVKVTGEPFKLLVKGKHSAGKSFQSFATQGKKLLI